jgi:hypothetical protein
LEKLLSSSDADLNRLTYEELLVLAAYRRVKLRRHGDLEISVVNGTLAKIWEVIKNDTNQFNLREANAQAAGASQK